jgi:hypothetical protein
VVEVLEIGIEGAPLRMGVGCGSFPGWGLTSAAFGSTLSWVRIEEDEVEGARRSLFPAEVCWKRTGAIEEELSTEEHDAEIVCFRDRYAEDRRHKLGTKGYRRT